MAVEANPPVVSALERLLTALQQRASALAPRSRVAWVPPERLHVTVRFIGHVGADRFEAIARVLEQPLNLPSFDATVAGVHAFPKSGSPRVVWAGVEQGAARLRDVEREVSARLQRLGMREEARDYAPHLTLGRVKEPNGLRARALLQGLEDEPIGTIRVDAVTLFDSRPSPKGPTYVALQRTGLAPVTKD